LIDGTFENYPSNLRGVTFSAEDGAYMAGTIAAMLSQSNTIGDLGGWPIPSVLAFTEGYNNGARCANPDITTIISYTYSFTASDLGAGYAQDMISQGADVIFASAGQAGNGAILTVTQSGVWAIGVDTDQYLTLFMSGTVPGSNYLLTSVIKHLDTGVYLTISDTITGMFTSGTVVYGLEEEGVGLAPYHETEEAITTDIRTRLDWVSRAIIGGSIDPLDPEGACLVVHQQYLPLTSKLGE
jgi:basic membrane protein A